MGNLYLFQRGFTPKRIGEHEEKIRAITVDVLDRLDGRERCDLVGEVAQPVVSRVIGSFMGIPPEDDEPWATLLNSLVGFGDPDLNPNGTETIMENQVPLIFDRCRVLIEERRIKPTDDLTSLLVHAEIDGNGLEEHEIVMGFFLLMAAGNDSTKATYCSAMRALMEHPDQRHLLLEEPELIPSAVEESLRMFPAFSHFRRTATKDTELNGMKIRKGDKVVMWYISANRDESVFPDAGRFDVRRENARRHLGFGHGVHRCVGARLAEIQLATLIGEIVERNWTVSLAGEPKRLASCFLHGFTEMPVSISI